MTIPGDGASDFSFSLGYAGNLASSRRTPKPQDHQTDKFGEEGAKRQAWLREMERAQLAGWFLPAGRETPSNKLIVKSPAILAHSRVRPDFVSDRGFPYSTVSDQVGQLSVSDSDQSPMGTTDDLHKRSPFLSYAHNKVSADFGSASSKGSDDARMQMGRCVSSDTQAEFDGNHSATVSFTAPGFSRGDEYTSVPPNSGAPQKGFDLPVFSTHLSSTPFVRTDSMRAAQVYGVTFQWLSMQEVDIQDGTGLPNLGCPRNPATRLHTQWSSEGLMLWIGLDGTARQVELQAQSIVNTLMRTLSSQGQRLSRVVCNGTVVFDRQNLDEDNRSVAIFSRFLDQEVHA